jgi:hypothetical protein
VQSAGLRLRPLHRWWLLSNRWPEIEDTRVQKFPEIRIRPQGGNSAFQNDEIGPEAVLASACLPLLRQAVEIDGEYYWDGGYMGNPGGSLERICP